MRAAARFISQLRYAPMPTATKPAIWDRRHLLGLHGMGSEDIISLIDAAEKFLPIVHGQTDPLNVLSRKLIAMLFFEDSTRTRTSFTIAAKHLGASSLDLSGPGSSLSKGETLADTARNLQAMGVHCIVVRSAVAGAAKMIADAVHVPVINAGDGRHEHPTQGLLDVMTMRQRLGELRGKTIAIVGDINGSRVARSNIHALASLGANVQLIGPPTLVPRTFEQIAEGPGRVFVSHNLDEVLPGADAIMMLRVQFERGTDITEDYREHFGLTSARAKQLKPGAIIMHPGPVNRGLEMDGVIADDPDRSVILQQVTNGVAVRMAVMTALMNT